MADAPWSGDTCSLVDAFRAGERSPVEELEATLAAIEASSLNAFSYLDPEAARAAAATADVTAPFGGVPLGVKELDAVAGWPATEASIPLRDEIAAQDSTKVARLRAAEFFLLRELRWIGVQAGGHDLFHRDVDGRGVVQRREPGEDRGVVAALDADDALAHRRQRHGGVEVFGDARGEAEAREVLGDAQPVHSLHHRGGIERRAAKLGRPDDERVLKHAALLQVLQ